MRNRLIKIGFTIILLTNALLLANVFYNRSSVPDSQLTLNERELNKSWRGQSKENSGMELILRWRVLPHNPKEDFYWNNHTPAWLDAQKMQALGFVPPRHADLARSTAVEKEVILVLELDGAAYQHALNAARARLNEARNQAEEPTLQSNNNPRSHMPLATAQRELDNELQKNSRLFVIDAGLDAATLRTRYPDRQRYALVRGLIKKRSQYFNNKPQWVGYLSEIHGDKIHIPREFESAAKTPHFTAQVAFGQKLEPWMVTLKAMP